MKYPCEIIKDLLPLYVDDIASEKSKDVVEDHLSECENCQEYHDAMKSYESRSKKAIKNSDDTKLADGLKKVKKKINKKFKIIIGCFVGVLVLLAVLYYVLFCLPVVGITADEVDVKVRHFKIEDMTRYIGPNDYNYDKDADLAGEGEAVYRMILPHSSYNMTAEGYAELLNESKYVSEICVYYTYYSNASYNYEVDGNTLYFYEFKRPLFDYLDIESESDFQWIFEEYAKIDKIIYVEDNKETILWEEQK